MPILIKGVIAEVGAPVTINEFEKFKNRLSTENIIISESIKNSEQVFQQNLAKLTSEINSKQFFVLRIS